ncbi:1-acyl-sn-glycerol-3-phosphate acyltransferase [Cyanobium sp. ULC082]
MTPVGDSAALESPMPSAKVQAAQPALGFIQPAYTPWLHRLCRLALPAVLGSRRIGIGAVSGVVELAELCAAAQNGEVRLLIAFRHPSTTDPLVMAQLLWKEVPRAARRHGIRLAHPVHSQFLYDRGIPLWAGAAAGWMLARLGGVPIQRGRLDRRALKTARHLLCSGPFPLAIAPEGATNNHDELLGPLEPGLAQMAFWCCEDLVAEGREERVVIVPVVLRYSLLHRDWAPIDRLLTALEGVLGITLPPAGAPALPTEEADHRYGRLLRISGRLLTQLEHFYRLGSGEEPGLTPGDPALSARLSRLQATALAAAESHFDLQPRGTILERCRRIEQAGWQAIYRDDLAACAPLERSLADWCAVEAARHLDHMRLVEYFASMGDAYVAEKPSVDRYLEVLLILWDAIAWIRGRRGERPPAPAARQVRIIVGEPIEAGPRLADYRRDRRLAVDQLTDVLRASLEAAMLD